MTVDTEDYMFACCEISDNERVSHKPECREEQTWSKRGPTVVKRRRYCGSSSQVKALSWSKQSAIYYGSNKVLPWS